MPLDIAFYVLLLIAVVFYLVDGRNPTPRYPWGWGILELLLFLIIGWKVFGPPIK